MEVPTGGCEDGVDSVAVAALEVVAVHAVLGLEVVDDRLDGGAALHLAFDRGGGSADLAGDPDAKAVGMVVAAIALVNVDALGLDADEVGEIGDDRPQGVAIPRVKPEGRLRIAVEGLGVEHELAALGGGDRGDDGDPAAELVGGAGLALADALDLGGMSFQPRWFCRWPRICRALPRGTAKTASIWASPSILRRISRISRPRRVRRNFNCRPAR